MRRTWTLMWVVALGASTSCATRSPKASDERDTKSHAQALVDPAVRSKVETLLTGYEYVPTEDDWKAIGPDALPALEAIYRDEKALPTTRMRAVSSMAFVENEQAGKTLEAIARDGRTEARYRSKAILALGHRGGPAAAPALAPMLEVSDVSLREATATALGQVGGEEAKKSLEARLDVEEETPVREAIQKSLTKLQP